MMILLWIAVGIIAALGGVYLVKRFFSWLLDRYR
jgi:hypothetical protein